MNPSEFLGDGVGASECKSRNASMCKCESE